MARPKLYAFLTLTLLLSEVMPGYSYTYQNHQTGQVSGGGTLYSRISHNTHHSGGSTSGGSTYTSHTYHSGGSSSHFYSAGGNGHNIVQHAPYEGRPQNNGPPPSVFSSVGFVTANEPISVSKTAIPILVEKSVVDVIIDAVAFVDDNARNLAREEIRKCLESSNLAVKILIDQDVFREFFNWELTFWSCYSNPDLCNVGWNVVPASLTAVSMEKLKGLSMDVNQADDNTFHDEKQMVARMFEVACSSYIARNADRSYESLQKLVDGGLTRHDVERFFSLVKMKSMITALQTRIHVCFPTYEKDEIIQTVRDVASYVSEIDCYVYAALNQERKPALPPERRKSLRFAPSQTGQTGPAPGTG